MSSKPGSPTTAKEDWHLLFYGAQPVFLFREKDGSILC